MKISVDLSDSELKDVIRITGERRKGPAIRKLVVNAIMMRRRALGNAKIMSGEWSVEFPHFEELRALDRKNPWK